MLTINALFSKQSLHYSSDGSAGTLSWNVLIAHCTWHRGCAKLDRRTGINRCRRTETVLYPPTQRWPSSGLSAVDAPSPWDRVVNRYSPMLCGLPWISSIHCGLTAACSCCCCIQAH